MEDVYRSQLKKVDENIRRTNDKHELNELELLRNKLVELIALSDENHLHEHAIFKAMVESTLESTNSNDEHHNVEDDSLSSEIKSKDDQSCSQADDTFSNSNTSCETIDDSHETTGIDNELADLQGSKCQAPFDNDYDTTSTYHNALILSTEIDKSKNQQSLDDILVNVIYTNPICNQMLPCEYFLSGKCKYSDEKCYFSHGTPVSLSQLREFKEPDFENLKVGCLVLAKPITSKLWSRATVLDITHSTSNNDGSCVVKYETKGLGEIEVPMQNIFPLINNDVEIYNISSDSEEESNIKKRDSEIVNKVLLNTIQPLGSWEKHTKGIGSKLMTKMGYIMGAGLGKNGEGRINPVETTVLPKGKSLDHCMNFKNTIRYQDTRRQRNQQKQLKDSIKRSYNKSLEKSPDVFTFLNNKLNFKNTNQNKNIVDEKKLKSSTMHNLNVRSLKIEEDVKRQQLQIQELKYKLSRTISGTMQHNAVNQKLIDAYNHLTNLKTEEKSIKKEHASRETHKKMTVF